MSFKINPHAPCPFANTRRFGPQFWIVDHLLYVSQAVGPFAEVTSGQWCKQPGTFFDKSSAELKPQLRTVLGVIASHIAELPNGLIVEGHTDGLPFGRDGYSNWELSVDRANSARRVLEAGGLPSNRLFEVRGYADRELKFVGDALDPRNRRISLLLPFDTPYVEATELDPETLAQQLGFVESAGGGA